MLGGLRSVRLRPTCPEDRVPIFTRNGIPVEGSAFASAWGRQRLARREGLPDRDRHILLVALQQIEAVEQATDTTLKVSHETSLH